MDATAIASMQEPQDQEDLSAFQPEEEEESQQSHSGHGNIFGGPLEIAIALFGIRPAVNYMKVRNAAQMLKSPDLARDLIDLDHPEKWDRIRAVQKLSGDFIKAKPGSSRHLSKEDLLRRRYATLIAKRLHLRYYKLADDIKIQSVARRYGIDEAQLRTRLDAWKQKYPGAAIDDGIIINSQQMHRENVTQNGGKTDDVKLKNDQGEMREEFASSYERAKEKIKTDQKEKGIFDRGQAKVQEILKPNSNVPLTDSLSDQAHFVKGEWQYVENGITSPPSSATAASAPQPSPVVQQQSTPIPNQVAIPNTPQQPAQSPTAKVSAQQQGQSSATASKQNQGGGTPKQQPLSQHAPVQAHPTQQHFASANTLRHPVTAPQMPSATILAQISQFVTQLKLAMQQAMQAMQMVMQKMADLAKRAIRRILNKVFDVVKRIINLVVKGIKLAINTGLNVIPGLGTAVDKFFAITSRLTGGLLSEENVIKIILIIFFGTIGVIIVLFILFIGKDFFGSGGEQTAMEFQSAPPNQQTRWYKFEKDYLYTSSPKPDLSWHEFEQTYLSPDQSFLTLEKPK